ncbi:uncharacterized protein Z519_10365 [Cladophialophora bantiana CBS 173.52]|uniref:Uncharacterized protein n=1 Tax=Cladophialophora bantiana (strain ATCC 10958 / CBS 173.52 / CDC B-1940 / NIH 8579) TaxID=1442370 RepID=A0A0D2EFP9_CLAB1|nr:uncharacterized protein Z519_10365 [Cladophialophora bantiana CBS 173.52]KIW88881.1 hypothetical protein Z519_10365 [Cladophialophora bantiana CBS 173.52]
MAGLPEPILNTYENSITIISAEVGEYVKQVEVEDISIEKEIQYFHEIGDIPTTELVSITLTLIAMWAAGRYGLKIHVIRLLMNAVKRLYHSGNTGGRVPQKAEYLKRAPELSGVGVKVMGADAVAVADGRPLRSRKPNRAATVSDANNDGARVTEKQEEEAAAVHSNRGDENV